MEPPVRGKRDATNYNANNTGAFLSEPFLQLSQIDATTTLHILSVYVSLLPRLATMQSSGRSHAYIATGAARFARAIVPRSTTPDCRTIVQVWGGRASSDQNCRCPRSTLSSPGDAVPGGFPRSPRLCHDRRTERGWPPRRQGMTDDRSPDLCRLSLVALSAHP